MKFVIYYSGLCIGMLVLGMAFFTKVAAATIIQFHSAMLGIFRGSILGLYVLGMHCPWANSVVSELKYKSLVYRCFAW